MGHQFDRAPFPYFGGKSKAAKQIWGYLGSDCKNYAEPFLGSAATWIQRPQAFVGHCVLNDFDAQVVNFWRAVKLHPEETAAAADNPVFEGDLHARHLALVNGSGRLRDRICADPEYCEPVLAGWWAWGACVWIGGHWCAGDGPWAIGQDEDGLPSISKKPNDETSGVTRRLPHLGNGLGVRRKLPHLGGGKGVNNLVCKGDRGRWILSWFSHLQGHFREAIVTCGDWERICSPKTLTRFGAAGVLLDPPYSQTDGVYAHDSSSVSAEVRAWCISNGDNPKLRIVLCGHLGEHDELQEHGWRGVKWEEAKGAGYSAQTLGADNREVLWVSPHCRNPSKKTATFF